MGKRLIVDRVVKNLQGDVHVHGAFDLKAIIDSGYAPDDVIEFVINKCADIHKSFRRDENINSL